MSAFLASVLDYEPELIAGLREWCTMASASCTARGKCVRIDLTILPSLQLDAYARITRRNRPVPKQISGGDYEVCLTHGFIIRLAFIFELYVQVWSHFRENGHLGAAPMEDLPRSDPEIQRLLSSKAIPEFQEMMRQLFVGTATREIAPALDKLGSIGTPSFFQKRASSATQRLLLNAIYFLITHENMHIERGHLEYLVTQCEVGVLPEFVRRGFPLDPTMQQQMETDADSQAFQILFRNLLDKASDAELRGETLRVDGLFGFYIALATLFSVFDQIPRTVDAYRESSHPDPAVRFHYAHLWTMMLVADILPNRRAQPEQIRKLMERSLAKSFSAIFLADRALGLEGAVASIFIDEVTGSTFQPFRDLSFKALENQIAAQEQWVDRAPQPLVPTTPSSIRPGPGQDGGD